MTLNFKLIGKRVKEIRMQQHISQAELAERIDMSVSYISHIENAKKQVSLEVLVRISNELGFTIDELLTGNQMYDHAEYQTDMDILMADCTSYEKRIIFELALAIKASIRENACLIEKDESF